MSNISDHAQYGSSSMQLSTFFTPIYPTSHFPLHHYPSTPVMCNSTPGAIISNVNIII